MKAAVVTFQSDSTAPKAPESFRIALDQRILVTAAEAASLLSMGRSTFWREVALCNLPGPVKIGGLTRWRVTDLQQFVQQLNSDAPILRVPNHEQ